MCFNENTSLTTFTISLVCFCYLLNRGFKTNNKNDIFLSILTILVGFMQLIEFFLWRNQTCNKINHYFSLAIILLLFMQVTIINICYLKLYPDASLFSKKIIHVIIFIYLIVTIYTLYHLNTYNLCSKPSIYSCRLVWDSFIKLNQNNKYILIRIR